MKKGIYIQNTPLEDALRLWQQRIDTSGIGPLKGEIISVNDSQGRVTAEAVIARLSAPFYHASAMDGYAVRFMETFGASETSPVRLRTGDQAVYVDTGDPLPDGFNAVIMIENVNKVGPNKTGPEGIEIIQPASPWQHVRVIGEDIVATELILPENHRIRPVDMGAVISGGHQQISVRVRPVVAIVPTGTELVEPGTALKTGDIIEYNSRILSGMVREWGGTPVRYGPVPDDLQKLKETLADACAKADLVVINAGSSAGSEDFTNRAIAELGEVILHGVNIKPGKPVILGWVNGKPVLGIPGYPVSAYITFGLFAKGLIHRMQGLEPPAPDYLTARLSRQVASNLGQEEFLRVKVGRVGENLIATPVSRGAGVLMSLVRADGFVRIPAMSEGFGAGTEVQVEMLRRREEIDHTIVCIGSHDNALDLLANVLKKRHPRFSLSSAHVGSMGGLVALKKGEAHLAGTHMLDEETGEYNVSYIRRLLGDRRITLINLVHRQQGFIVRKGNPKGVRRFEDLTRDDLVFINRQAGAGTRMLTDKHLRELNIYPSMVKGYDREEYTHMGVASAVLTGIADAGMGILAAALALGLDFVPVARERYDLAIPTEYLAMEGMSALLGIIRGDAEFRNSVEALGGYDVSDMGRVIFES